LYQQLAVTQGSTAATWLVLAADDTKLETLTFPLLVLNASSGDLNQILVSGSLAPVSEVTIASATALTPRYRDLSVPQKLVNLRVSTSIQGGSSPSSPVAARAPQTGSGAITIGSNVTFVTQVI